MEPTELNSSPDDEARLETWLREPARALPDDGFSTRVLAALPPPVTRPISTRRWVLCGLAAAVGLAVAWPRAGTGGEVVSQLSSWTDALTMTGTALADPMAQIALVVAALSLVAVFWRSDRLTD
jgi:hypothetical protein